MATENIMMDAVKAGGDRQELHEKIRQYSMEASARVKKEGLANNLLELIAADPAFKTNLAALESKLAPENYVGRAPEQTEEFLRDYVQPLLAKYAGELGLKAEIFV